MIDSSEEWVWSLYSFIDHRGNSVVQDWYDSQSDKVKAEFDTRFIYLRVAKDTEWIMPYARALHKKCKGFIEVRFKVDRQQYRAIGFRGPEQRIYTVLRMVDSHFDEDCGTDKRLRDLILKNRSYRHEPDCFSDLVKEAEEKGIS